MGMNIRDNRVVCFSHCQHVTHTSFCLCLICSDQTCRQSWLSVIPQPLRYSEYTSPCTHRLSYQHFIRCPIYALPSTQLCMQISTHMALAVAMHCNVKATRRRATRRQSFWAVFWPNVYFACTQTAIAELAVQILNHLIRMFNVQIEYLPYFYFRSI